MASSKLFDPIESKLKQYNQEHLMRFVGINSEEENRLLYQDLLEIDFDSLFQRKFFQTKDDDFGSNKSIDSLLEPLSPSVHQRIAATSVEDLQTFRNLGLKAIADGKVAALLLAGGQGTRLGSSSPKGMFDIELPSRKTLYQLQAERICRLQHLAKKRFLDAQRPLIHWYIMTSEQTMRSTIEFFEHHNYFGLERSQIIFFEQYSIPCFDFDGKILLDRSYKISRSPNGNGGLYEAIRKKGILDHMQQQAIEHVQVYCVDNILVKVADPTFIGYCQSKNAECGAKVVEKTDPNEAVGIICKVNERFKVVEYSEVSRETSEKRNPIDGRLLFNAGNICNHYFTLEFLLNKVRDNELEYHVAKKKIPYIDENRHRIVPNKPNGIKLEKFIFDVFRFADPKKFAVWEVLREEEFSPLKNNDQCDQDTPTTARNSLFKLHHKYLVKAGAVIDEDSLDKNDEKNPIICEISPLITYDGEDLSTIIKDQKIFKPPICLN
uniref:UDP-N-acetylglucosamine diphosphorylase n=1 Tax=Sarcoptes scabiei TaxID=52283 RepID=A0A834VFB7_SARSC